MIQGRFWEAQPVELHDAIQAALRSSSVKLARLVEFDFSTGPVRLCDWAVPMTDGANGYEWTPMIAPSRVEDIKGGPDDWAPVRKYSMTIPLDVMRELTADIGPYPDLRDKTVYQDREASMWLQLMDPTPGLHGVDRPLGHPVTLHRGRMDRVQIGLTRDGVEHSLYVEGVLARKGVQGSGYLTPRDQKRRHAGDLFLDYVLGLPTQPAKWPDY
ncbi:MAG: hypothetical protein AAGF30_00340 [Pseudomonadota bacterium]